MNRPNQVLAWMRRHVETGRALFSMSTADAVAVLEWVDALEAPPAVTVPLPLDLAHGVYLNDYGRIYGLPRILGEDDQAYRARLADLVPLFAPPSTMTRVDHIPDHAVRHLDAWGREIADPRPANWPYSDWETQGDPTPRPAPVGVAAFVNDGDAEFPRAVWAEGAWVPATDEDLAIPPFPPFSALYAQRYGRAWRPRPVGPAYPFARR